MKSAALVCLSGLLAACAEPAQPTPSTADIAAFQSACRSGPGYSMEICACLADRAGERFDRTRVRLIAASLNGEPIRGAAGQAGLDPAETGEISRFVMETLPACAGGQTSEVPS